MKLGTVLFVADCAEALETANRMVNKEIARTRRRMGDFQLNESTNALKAKLWDELLLTKNRQKTRRYFTPNLVSHKVLIGTRACDMKVERMEVFFFVPCSRAYIIRSATGGLFSMSDSLLELEKRRSEVL